MHFETAIFRCANGDTSPGVRAMNGPAVCWCSDYANAELIAKALNQYTKLSACGDAMTKHDPTPNPHCGIKGGCTTWCGDIACKRQNAI